ncbi:MAG: triose-phosphate isomerase [Candidatus Cloacimonadales bacterium]
MRKIIVAGNWKMNHNLAEATKFVQDVLPEIKKIKANNVEMFIAPSFLFIEKLKELATSSQLKIGSQDVSSQEKGAYTGEVSAEMLTSIKCDFAIIGHSERRSYHHESNELIRTKLNILFAHKLRPIVCIGETLEQREAGITKDVILTQLKGCFADIDLNSHLDVVIAYEPVWAIGTGKTATPEMAEEVHALIRNWLAETYNTKTAEAIHILYGGSVSPKNIAELLAQKNIDGGLIGGAALKADSYLEMIKIAGEL